MGKHVGKAKQIYWRRWHRNLHNMNIQSGLWIPSIWLESSPKSLRMHPMTLWTAESLPSLNRPSVELSLFKFVESFLMVSLTLKMNDKVIYDHQECHFELENRIFFRSHIGEWYVKRPRQAARFQTFAFHIHLNVSTTKASSHLVVEMCIRFNRMFIELLHIIQN